MRRVRTTRFAAAALAGVLATAGLAGCGGKSVDSGDGGGSSAKPGHKVGLAYDIGGRGDKSFNDAAYRGLVKAKKDLGVTFKDLEAKSGDTDTDRAQRLTLLAQQGYNPVLAIGYDNSKAIGEVAPKFPKTKFAIVDDATNKDPNLTNLVFTEQQSSYLVGAAAALKTKTGKVGFIGGVDTPLIHKFEAGYEAGARKIKPKIDIQYKYISEPPDNSGFKDPSKGRTIAQGMYDKGADVVYAAAGLSGNGVFQAAAKNKKWAIGVDSDQYKSAPADEKQYILTSALKGVDTAVYSFIKSVQDGTAKGGTIRFSLKGGGVGYSKSNKAAIKGLVPKLDSLKKQIIAGKITPPTKPTKQLRNG